MKDIEQLEEIYEVVQAISVSPVTGLERVCCYSRLEHNTSQKYITCLLHIYTMKDGLTIENSPEMFQYFEKMLVVSNQALVNNSGVVVRPENQTGGETYTGEYDYYTNLIKQGVNIYIIIRQAILAADANERFNNR